MPEPRPAVTLWRLAWLAVCALGIMADRERAPLAPWPLLLASKLLVTVLFLGYARRGAACIPALAPLAALALDRWLDGSPITAHDQLAAENHAAHRVTVEGPPLR